MRIYTQIITVATAGTIQAVSASGIETGLVRAIHFQGMVANTGRVNIGTSALVSSTGVGLIKSLGKDPGSANDIPHWMIESPSGANDIDPSIFRVDVTVSGEKVLVTCFQA